MLISGFATVLGIAVVIGVIGYRVFRSEGSAAPAEVTAMLPKGARIVATAVADGPHRGDGRDRRRDRGPHLRPQDAASRPGGCGLRPSLNACRKPARRRLRGRGIGAISNGLAFAPFV